MKLVEMGLVSELTKGTKRIDSEGTALPKNP